MILIFLSIQGQYHQKFQHVQIKNHRMSYILWKSINIFLKNASRWAFFVSRWTFFYIFYQFSNDSINSFDKSNNNGCDGHTAWVCKTSKGCNSAVKSFASNCHASILYTLIQSQLLSNPSTYSTYTAWDKLTKCI